MKKLTHLLLLCFTAISSIFCASAADQDNSTASGLGGIFSEIHWHPALFKGPIEIKDGQILSGTSGTIGGERTPAPDDDISKPFNDWWNG